MKVADLIGSRKEVFSIIEETSVHQAAQYLREKQVRSVGVVDGSGKVIGVIPIATFPIRSPRRTNVRLG